MAYPRFAQQGHRLRVTVIDSRRIDGKVRAFRLGELGAVTLADPISLADRVKFWSEVNQRFLAIRERHPDRLSEEAEIAIRNKIGKKIPRARNEAEFKAFLQATIKHDMICALEKLDAGEDGVREAAKQLLKLARESRRAKRKTEASEM